MTNVAYEKILNSLKLCFAKVRKLKKPPNNSSVLTKNKSVFLEPWLKFHQI